jgi:tetratricopeptide (TPR) repeat protein
MAIAFTKTGQPDEAIRHYRKALELDPTLTGAHYGIAYLLLKRGELDSGAQHLRAFLGRPPKGPDADKWVRHAETTLRDLEVGVTTPGAEAAEPA